MGTKQIAAIHLLKNYKGKESGRALYYMLMESGMSHTSAYISIKHMLGRGYLKVKRWHRNASPLSIDNTYTVTQKGEDAALQTLSRRKGVKVDPNVIRFDRKKVVCESGSCQHAEGDICQCSCLGAHHGKLVKLTAKQKRERIKILSAELAALLAA